MATLVLFSTFPAKLTMLVGIANNNKTREYRNDENSSKVRRADRKVGSADCLETVKREQEKISGIRTKNRHRCP